jgi:hypothetical protein
MGHSFIPLRFIVLGLALPVGNCDKARFESRALPELFFLLRLDADLATLNALKKGAGQLALAGMAFAVHRAEVEEFIA